jgi:hypothetical protein
MASASTSPLVLLLLLSAATAASSAPAAAAPRVSVAGEPVRVWSAVDTLHKCGFIDVPDIPARAFVDGASGLTRYIVGSTSYHRMSGPSLLNATRDCAAAWNETASADPSLFAGDEFLDSPHAFANGTVYALVHTEYPGNVYHNCSGPAYPHCWTVSVGLAVSYDAGLTWAHAREPPGHLVAAVPYAYNASQLAYGWGDPSNIIERGGFFYAAVWNRNQVGLQAPGVCMMRTADLSDPTSWRAWGGAAYDVPFVSPYTMAPGTEAAHICTVTNLPSCPIGGFAWSTFLGTFVATMDCSLQGGEQFYLATSDDLITWTTPQPLYSAKDLPANVSKNVTAMTYPTWLDPAAPASGDPNFMTISATPYLFWVSIGHSPYTDGRALWATPMLFS